jgi:hypothetical protein
MNVDALVNGGYFYAWYEGDAGGGGRSCRGVRAPYSVMIGDGEDRYAGVGGSRDELRRRKASVRGCRMSVEIDH